MPTSPVAVVEILEGDVSCRAAAVRPKAAAQVIQFEGLLVTQSGRPHSDIAARLLLISCGFG